MKLDKEVIIDKMQRFCAYRERCHSEVRSKLLTLKVYGDDLEDIMTELIKEGYLNEERFARAFVRGKNRMNHWGRMKIGRELRRKGVSDYCIKMGMEELLPEEYQDQLAGLLARYCRVQGKKYEGILLRKKAYNYALRKGYESDLIQKVLDRVLRED